MGFPSNPPNREKLCSQTKNLLTNMFNGFPELQAAYQDDSASSSYNDFLRNLERNGTQKETDIPLTTCKRISHAYLRSKQNGTEITNAIDKIKGELSSLSKSLTLYSTSSTDYFSNLKGHISSLLGKINTFDPNSVPSPVAPVAPLAGAVTTLTAAGGAGAAYGLNLFGIQGIVKALFGFK
ncbi:chain-length determining protein [Babesia caballi]|uniref:Chain-length determining protein n=1 Tax=Babesia caballi TaxID=5871 RepID=A0AAV4LTB9_BABCB|nr:chain-length determining protein [Babesia caballi]